MTDLKADIGKLRESGITQQQIEKELFGKPNGAISRYFKTGKGIPDDKIPVFYSIYDSVLKGNTPNPVVKTVVKSPALPKQSPALIQALEKINKDFGEGAIMNMSGNPKPTKVVSTGSLSLDSALGVMGLPTGRVVEIYGPESSGKTTIAMHVIAESQKQGGKCAFIDAEHAFDEQYAAKLGVNTGDLLISQPDYGEQALEIADRLICTESVSVIVIDSVAALVPKGELEGEMGDSKMGLQARLMSQALRKMTASLSKTGTILIFINQLREKIGIMFGNPETTTGGNALKFYASVRLDVRKIGQLKDGDSVIGNRVKVKVVKNKVAPPFKTVEFDLIFGQGIDRYSEIIDLAVERGIIEKSGSWFSYKGDKLGQGKSQVKQILIDNEDIYTEIKNSITINHH